MLLFKFPFAIVLNVSATQMELDSGEKAHTHITRSYLQRGTFVQSTLVDIYAKGGNVESVRQVFYRMLIFPIEIFM